MNLLKEQINTEVELLFQKFRITNGYKETESSKPIWKNSKNIEELKTLIKTQLEKECNNV